MKLTEILDSTRASAGAAVLKRMILDLQHSLLDLGKTLVPEVITLYGIKPVTRCSIRDDGDRELGWLQLTYMSGASYHTVRIAVGMPFKSAMRTIQVFPEDATEAALSEIKDCFHAAR